MTTWLTGRWVVGAGFMAIAVLAIVPMFAALVPPPVLAILLCSPVYMIHQVEEHRDDRFRRFVNAKLFGGRPAMTATDVLVVNVMLVWGLNLASAYAALFATPGAGLIAPYAMLVNGIGHVAVSIRMRAYNPGLTSAVLLFVPLSLVTILLVGSLPSTTPTQHLVAVGGAVLIHALIALNAMRRARRERLG